MVSIVTPVYNRTVIVQSTINSVLSQEYKNWECIIVDDRSTDETFEFLTEYVKKDNRIQCTVKTNNKVTPTCRNIGLAKAVGDYVIFLDSDDELLSHCLENRFFFEKYKSQDFLVFPMGVNSDIGVSKKEIPVNESYLKDFLSYNLPWQTMCPIWKTSFIRKLNGFKEGYPRLNDPELMIRALLIPDVNFKVFNDIPYDTVYYPSVSNWVLMIDKYYDSLQLFIPDISNELEKRGQLELKKNLRGYLKVWYRDFFFPSNKNLTSQNKNLIKLFRKNDIITLRASLMLKARFYIFIFLSYINRKIKNSQIANLG